MLGDMNAWIVKNFSRNGVLGRFGVRGRKINGKSQLHFRKKYNLWFFDKKVLLNYITLDIQSWKIGRVMKGFS